MNIGLMNKYRPQRNPANDLQLLTGAVSVFARVCRLGRVSFRRGDEPQNVHSMDSDTSDVPRM